jgi:hypothetical protein
MLRWVGRERSTPITHNRLCSRPPPTFSSISLHHHQHPHTPHTNNTQQTPKQDWGAVLSLFRSLQSDHYHPTAPMCHAALKAALALNDLGTAVAAMKTLVREGWNFGR